VDDGGALSRPQDLGPPAERANGGRRQLAATGDVGGAGGVGRDGGDGDESLEKLLEAAPLPFGEREEMGPV
jgi:hypothetical protein